jgi:phage shock protein C
MTGKLMRTQNDRMISGVCGGLGRYLHIDPVLVRFAFVLFTLAGGAGALIYLILLIVMPLDTTAGNVVDYGSMDDMDDNERERRTSMLVGGGLILVGLFYLLGRIPGLAWLSFGNLWPLLLIVVGVSMIVNFMSKQEN